MTATCQALDLWELKPWVVVHQSASMLGELRRWELRNREMMKWREKIGMAYIFRCFHFVFFASNFVFWLMGFGNCDSLLSSTWIQSCASILVLFGYFFRDDKSTTSIELEGNRPEICKNRESFFSKSYIFGSKRFPLFHVIFSWSNPFVWKTRWWFQRSSIFTTWGKWSNLTIIFFKMGWN